MTLTEDNPVLLQCAARRVLPLPQFQIRVRNNSVSEHLTPNATVNVHCRNPGCGPVHYDLDAVVTVQWLVVRHRDDGHYVTCSASLPHSNWTPSLTSVRLNVRCMSCNCSFVLVTMVMMMTTTAAAATTKRTSTSVLIQCYEAIVLYTLDFLGFNTNLLVFSFHLDLLIPKIRK